MNVNIYDTKSIKCIICGKFIGEIDYDAQVILPKCGKCANPKPEGGDSLSYLESRLRNDIMRPKVATVN